MDSSRLPGKGCEDFRPCSCDGAKAAENGRMVVNRNPKNKVVMLLRVAGERFETLNETTNPMSLMKPKKLKRAKRYFRFLKLVF